MSESAPKVPSGLKEVLDQWRKDAERLRLWGAEAEADALERAASAAASAFIEWWTEPLSVKEAAEWSGYSVERLRELARSGVVPDQRPVGSARGKSLSVRRCDLPRHPVQKRDSSPSPTDGENEDASPATRAHGRAP